MCMVKVKTNLFNVQWKLVYSFKDYNEKLSEKIPYLFYAI